MQATRVRVFFAKQGELRFIGHRDLVRVFERLFRRASLELRFSEGFHPRVKLSFPSALAVGIEGTCEVMEVELAAVEDQASLLAQMRRHAVPGLVIRELQVLEPGCGKAKVTGAEYQIEVPSSRCAAAKLAVDELLRQESMLVTRPGKPKPVEIRQSVRELNVASDGFLRMELAVDQTGSVRPREILNALGLGDLEQEGAVLRRDRVVLQEKKRIEQQDASLAKCETR